MGIWDFIINPMVTLLIFLYSLLNNDIVLAIVVLTVAIRMLMYPLMAQQRRSMKMQQKLQPKLKELQEKYKDDREKLAQAQMELYRENGFNPFGGCLPLFLQFPIFIALYQAIFFAVASTPFQLVDLSERLMFSGLDGLIPLQNMWLGMNITEPPSPPNNPAYALILPAIVMATTWLQFKMTQAQAQPNKDDEEEDDSKKEKSGNDAMDQAQAVSQSMGTFMPIMFGFISLSLSVGLAVYFIASNAVTILQYSSIGDKYLGRLFGAKDDEDEPALAVAADAAASATKKKSLNSGNKTGKKGKK